MVMLRILPSIRGEEVLLEESPSSGGDDGGPIAPSSGGPHSHVCPVPGSPWAATLLRSGAPAEV